jgi:hypothetical protein
MIGRKRRTPTLFVSTDTSQIPPPGFDDCEADDEGTMSTDEYKTTTRPLSVAIPQAQGPYCPRWPTLQEILSNTAPPPWTLTQFMAYLSQNHCLETLEFTMDASRYRKQYSETFSTHISPDSEACKYVKMLWQRLRDAYIAPNGPREVNLPCDVRDRLLSLPNHNYPPPPDSLDQAVKIIYELMDESVLVPFLNSISSYRNTQTCASPWNSSDENLYMQGSLDDRLLYTRSRSRRESSPPPPAMADFVSSSYTPSATSYRSGRSPVSSSQMMSNVGRGNRLSTHISSSSSYGSGDMLTDDSGSASSVSGGPMTPPTTPPTSDAGGSSPKSRSGDAWKKMTGRLGWKKKSVGGLRDHHRCPELEDEGGLL